MFSIIFSTCNVFWRKARETKGYTCQIFTSFYHNVCTYKWSFSSTLLTSLKHQTAKCYYRRLTNRLKNWLSCFFHLKGCQKIRFYWITSTSSIHRKPDQLLCRRYRSKFNWIFMTGRCEISSLCSAHSIILSRHAPFLWRCSQHRRWWKRKNEKKKQLKAEIFK